MQKIFNKIKENKKRILHLLYQFVLVLIGTFVLAVANAFFLVPFSIVSGGISGIGIILADAGFLTVDIWQYILCWGLFFLGSIILGFKFTFNTLVSTIFYPIFLSILVRTPIGLNFVDLLYGVEGATQLVNGVLTIQAPLADAGRMLIIALFGGALVGVGCGITFIGGGSTGGVDIISFVVPENIDRVKMIAKEATGFIYFVPSIGSTSSMEGHFKEITNIIEVLKENTNIPIALGFGINTTQQAEFFSEIADGIIVGNAIVKIVEKYGKNSPSQVFDYVKTMKSAIKIK